MWEEYPEPEEVQAQRKKPEPVRRQRDEDEVKVRPGFGRPIYTVMPVTDPTRGAEYRGRRDNYNIPVAFRSKQEMQDDAAAAAAHHFIRNLMPKICMFERLDEDTNAMSWEIRIDDGKDVVRKFEVTIKKGNEAWDMWQTWKNVVSEKHGGAALTWVRGFVPTPREELEAKQQIMPRVIEFLSRRA
jgi:hypothetical protein